MMERDILAKMEAMLGKLNYDPPKPDDLDTKLVSVDGGKTYITMREFMEKHEHDEEREGTNNG